MRGTPAQADARRRPRRPHAGTRVPACRPVRAGGAREYRRCRSRQALFCGALGGARHLPVVLCTAQPAFPLVDLHALGAAREGPDCRAGARGTRGVERRPGHRVARRVPDAGSSHPGPVRPVGRRARRAGAAGGTAFRDRDVALRTGCCVCGAQGRGVGRGGVSEGSSSGGGGQRRLDHHPEPCTGASEACSGSAGGSDRRTTGPVRRRGCAFPHRCEDGGRAHLRRTAAVVSLGAQHARRDAARSGPVCRSGGRVSRGPQVCARDRLVAVGAGARTPRRREGAGSG